MTFEQTDIKIATNVQLLKNVETQNEVSSHIVVTVDLDNYCFKLIKSFPFS